MHEVYNPYSDTTEKFESEHEAKEYTLLMYITNLAYQSSLYFTIFLFVLYAVSFYINMTHLAIIDTSILSTILSVGYQNLKYHT